MRKEHFRRKVMKNCSKNYNWSLKCYLIIFISKGTIIGVKKEVNCMNIQKFTQKSIVGVVDVENARINGQEKSLILTARQFPVALPVRISVKEVADA